MRLRLRLWWMVVALLVLAMAGLIGWRRIVPRHELAKLRARLAAEGVRLTTAEFVIMPDPVQREAAHRLLLAAGNLGTVGKVLPDDGPSAMVMAAAGRARPGWSIAVLGSEKRRVTNTWEAVAADLEAGQSLLARVRDLSRVGGLDWGVDYSQPVTRMNHLSSTRTVHRWLLASTEFGLRQKRLEDALIDLESQLQLLGALEGRGMLIDELVRLGIASSAWSSTWDALAAAGWTDEQLRRMDEAWAGQEFIGSMMRAIELERAMALEEYARCRENPTRFAQYLIVPGPATPGTSGGSLAQFTDWLQRAVGGTLGSGRALWWAWFESWSDEQCYLELSEALLTHTRRSLAEGNAVGGGGLESVVAGDFLPALDAADQERAGRFGFASQGFPPWDSMLSKAFRQQMMREMARAVVAIKRHQLLHGSVPETLVELVPAFLEQLPLDWMDGRPLRYRRLGSDRFLLYSVHENGSDEAGDPTSLRRGDRVVQPFQGRDFVWPTVVEPADGEGP